ncbi:hypothetical protein BG28_07385 [Nesterenkonia sp. AN1]|nr:hypothetical protein BG28_07385 [Nesterenkonia sp. AN1]
MGEQAQALPALGGLPLAPALVILFRIPAGSGGEQAQQRTGEDLADATLRRPGTQSRAGHDRDVVIGEDLGDQRMPRGVAGDLGEHDDRVGLGVIFFHLAHRVDVQGGVGADAQHPGVRGDGDLAVEELACFRGEIFLDGVHASRGQARVGEQPDMEGFRGFRHSLRCSLAVGGKDLIMRPPTRWAGGPAGHARAAGG